MAARSGNGAKQSGRREGGNIELLSWARSLSLIEIGTIAAIFLVLFFVAPRTFVPVLCGLSIGFALFVIAASMVERSAT